LYPIAVLPNQIGNLTMTLISLGILIFVARRNKMSLLSFLFAMSMPQMAFVVCNGGTDALTILGFVLNPVVGLFFVLIKPQLSIGVLLFWLIEAWNKGKIKQVVNVFLPAGLVYGLFLVYYFTHQHNGGMDYLLKAYWNTAIWPGGIPIGLGLLLHAIRSKRKGIFILSSPFFAPYIARYTWAMPIFGSNLDDLEMFIVWIGMWIVTIIKFSGG
jgi:hypothetical protein